MPQDSMLNASRETLEKEKRQEQKGGTCYAHAVATALHLATKRIVGYEAPPELRDLSFKSLRDTLIGEYGDVGATTKNVLDKYCGMLRFRAREVGEEEARDALNAQRQVVCRWKWRGNQRQAFNNWWKREEHKKRVMDRLPPPVMGQGMDA